MRERLVALWDHPARVPAVDVAIAFFVFVALVLGALYLPARVDIDLVVLLFLPAAAAAAFWRGATAGLCVAGVGLATGLWLGPHRGFSDFGAIWFYLVFGAIASALGAWAVRRRREREASARVLAEREAHLRS